MNYSNLLRMIFAAMLFNGILGCLLYGIWRLVRRALTNHTDIQMTYLILRLILLYLIIPAAGVLELCHWLNNGYTVVLPLLLDVGQRAVWRSLALVWLGVGALLLLRQLVLRWQFRRLARRNSTPASLVWIRQAEAIRQDMGIRRGVECRERYGDESAFVCGIFRPVIYVPVRQCTREEMEAVLTHEFTHVLEWDLLWKALSKAVCCIYWPMAPVWRGLCRDIQNWSEFNCDYLSCARLGSAKLYFRIIERFMGGEMRWYGSAWAAGLNISEKELILRMRTMVSQQRISSRRVRWVLLLMSAFLLTASTSVMAASYSTLREYRDSYWNELDVVIDEEDPEDLVVDFGSDVLPILVREPGWEEAAILMGPEGAVDGSVEGFTQIEEDGSVLFGWNMEPGQICVSQEIMLDGNKEMVLGCAPDCDGYPMRIGLVYPDGTVHYVLTQWDALNSYYPGQTGAYRIFAENVSSGKMIGGGFLMPRDPVCR